MWIVRDKDGELKLFTAKPFKTEDYEKWLTVCSYTVSLRINSNYFPEVKWEDEEPTEVELIIKK